MKSKLFATILAFAISASSAFADDTSKRRLVLISSQNANITNMTNTDVRRVYLGLSDTSTANAIWPIGNRSDRLLYEVFLQKIVFMSARNYERLLISHVYQTGGQRITMYEAKDDVIAQLKKTPNSVSYMWENDAKDISQIRIVQTIWEGNIE